MDLQRPVETGNSEGIEKAYYWANFIMIIVIVAALGLWIFNMFIEWKYNAQILAGPCQTCVALNPEWKSCYDYITKPVPIVQNYSFGNVSGLFSSNLNK